MENKILTINISDVNKPKNNIQAIDEAYVEIKPENLKYMYGSWIRYADKENVEMIHPGGKLVELSFEGNQLFLRTIKGEFTQLKLTKNIFYCKNDSESYRAMKELIHSYERLEHEKKLFEIQKKEFDLRKKKYSE